MPTPEGEQKEGLSRFVVRTIGAVDAALGFRLEAQTALTQLPGTVGGYQALGFATGYDGTDTVVPFTTDISFPDGPDLIVD